jgi:hypothetical protein
MTHALQAALVEAVGGACAGAEPTTAHHSSKLTRLLLPLGVSATIRACLHDGLPPPQNQTGSGRAGGG